MERGRSSLTEQPRDSTSPESIGGNDEEKLLSSPTTESHQSIEMDVFARSMTTASTEIIPAETDVPVTLPDGQGNSKSVPQSEASSALDASISSRSAVGKETKSVKKKGKAFTFAPGREGFDGRFDQAFWSKVSKSDSWAVELLFLF